jgi:hypothetical protein
MIEILSGFPDNVVACAGKGRITKDDYEKVLIPRIEQALSRNAKIRCYYQLEPDYSGFDADAMWEDFKVGVEHLTRWERVAFITDVEWMRFIANAIRFLMPGEVRVYSNGEAAEARRWIAAA